MVAATYTSDLTDIYLFESTTGISAYGGGGAGLGAGADYAIEGVNAVDKQVSASEKGFMYDNGVAFTIGADDHFFIWLIVGTPGIADSRNNRGIHVSMGDSVSAFVKFHVNGNDTLPKGGIVPYPIRFVNTTLTNLRTLVGAPGTTPQWIGGGANVTASAKFANFAADAARIGTGYDILNGTGADPEASFSGVATDDESTAEGILQNANGGFDLQGKLRIGSGATACEFLDQDGNIFIIDTLHSLTDFTEILVENASSILTLTDYNFIALGTNNRGRLEAITSAAVLAFTSVGFIDFGACVLGSGSTMTNCRWVRADQITQNSAVIDGGVVDSTTAAEAILSNNPTNVKNLTFTSDGSSHAVRCDTVGTYNWDGNFDSGYTGSRGTNLTSSSGSTNAAFYNNSGGLITLDVIGGGQAPSVRNGAGATTQVNASVSVNVSGVTEGTSVKLIARETLGDVTDGDTLAEGFADSTGLFTYSHNDQGTLSISVVARNQGIAVAAIAEDGGVFTDETAEGSSNATADMTLLPATPVVGDAYYFGHDEEFARVKLSVSTALVQSVQHTVVWEYWNGAWVALSGVVDGTNQFETAGENIISFTQPGDWATTTINAQGPLKYVRARLSVLGTITTTPVGRRCSLDVTRYFPYDEEREIVTGDGLNDIASWTEDKISKFDPAD